MGRPCTICRLKRRRDLERDYTAGVSLAELATRYHVSRDAVRRHLQDHYMIPVDAPLDEGIRMQGLGALEEALQRDITRLRELATMAADEGDLRQSGALLGLCIQGHTALLASRDRRLGHNAKLWARVLPGLLRQWGDERDQAKQVLDALASGSFLDGNVQVELVRKKNQEAESTGAAGKLV